MDVDKGGIISGTGVGTGGGRNRLKCCFSVKSVKVDWSW